MSLDQYEPSACDCKPCRQTCLTEPGILAPGDLGRITAHLGMEDSTSFVTDHFRARDGIDHTFGNETIRVPTITPARLDGRCIFLTTRNRCGIHAVRPFGCATCNACQGGNPEAVIACVEEIAGSQEYLEDWTAIAFAGIVA